MWQTVTDAGGTAVEKTDSAPLLRVYILEGEHMITRDSVMKKGRQAGL